MTTKTKTEREVAQEEKKEESKFNPSDYSVEILLEKTTLEKANDKKFPTDAFNVTYKVDGKEQHDLVVAAKQIEIFDTYYDKYKKDFVFMKQSEGRANPKLWGNPAPKSKNKS